MRRQMLFVVMLLLATAAFAAGLTPERAIAPPVLGPAPYAQASPSIASDGDGFFAAWRDNRLGSRTTTIVGTRLDRNGNPLDGGGLLFNRPDPSDDIFYSGNPYVLWTGTEYAIFWPEEDGTMQARVSREGEFILNSRTPVFGERIFGAAQVGAVSALLTRSSSMHVVLIGSDGLIATVPIPAVADPETELQSLIASNGSEFVVATMILRSDCSCVDLRAIRIKPDGTIPSTVRSTTSLIQGKYAFAASGDRYFFAVSSLRGLTGHVFDAALQAKVDTLFISSDTTLDSVDGSPVIADGDSFVVAWPQGQTGATILAQRFTRDGASTGPRITVATTTTRKSAPALARNLSERVETVWTEKFDPEENESDIAGRPFTSDGTTVTPAPVTISLGAASQERPVAAFNGRNYLLAWVEQRGVAEGRRVVAARVTPAGVALDAPMIVSDRLPESEGSSDLSGPAVASNGDDFIVVWRLAGGIAMRRLASDATWLDTAAKVVAPSGYEASPQSIAFNEGEYLLVYGAYTGETRSIWGVTVSPYGTTGTPFPISPAGQTSAGAVVTATGDAYLVAWTYTPPPICNADNVCVYDTDIVGARVTLGGAVIDTTPIQVSAPRSATGANDFAREASIATNGESTLVFWRTDDARYGARFANGSVATVGSLLLAASSLYGNLVPAWDGRKYQAFGSEAANGRDTTWTLYDVPLTGAPSLTAPSIVASNFTIGELGVRGAIETTSNGGMLVAYPHVVFGPDTGHVSRLFVRTSPPQERSRAIRR